LIASGQHSKAYTIAYTHLSPSCHQRGLYVRYALVQYLAATAAMEATQVRCFGWWCGGGVLFGGTDCSGHFSSHSLTHARTHARTHNTHTHSLSLSLSTNVQLYGDSPMSALPAVLECASVCQSLGKLFVGLALLLVLFPPRGVPLTRSTHSLLLLVPRFDNIEFQNRHFAVQNSNSTRSAVGWVAAIGSGTSQHLGPLQFQNTRRRTHVPGQMFVGHGQSWQYSIGRWCHSWGCQEKIESTNVYRSGTGVDRCLGRLPRDVLHQRHVGSHVFDGQIVRQLWKSPRIQKSSGGQVC
jgi:hypothetical protein